MVTRLWELYTLCTYRETQTVLFTTLLLPLTFLFLLALVSTQYLLPFSVTLSVLTSPIKSNNNKILHVALVAAVYTLSKQYFQIILALALSVRVCVV